MDYIDLIEKYVLESWADGQTTPEIKRALKAKRWPIEMVELVIDRLVKQKVRKKAGVMKNLTGPDLWSQPTWPLVDSWATRAKKKLKKVTEQKGALIETKLILPKMAMKQKWPDNDRQSKSIKRVKLDKSIFLPKEILLKQVSQQKKITQSTLAKNRQKQRKNEEQILMAQKKALGLCLVLFLILIFALYWQKFVIK